MGLIFSNRSDSRERIFILPFQNLSHVYTLKVDGVDAKDNQETIEIIVNTDDLMEIHANIGEIIKQKTKPKKLFQRLLIVFRGVQ